MQDIKEDIVHMINHDNVSDKFEDKVYCKLSRQLRPNTAFKATEDWEKVTCQTCLKYAK